MNTPLTNRLRGLALILWLAVTACSPNRWVWSGGQITAPPVRVGDLVLVASSEFGVRYSVSALDWKTGDPRWVQPSVGWGPCQQLIADEAGAFALCGALITALDLNSGAVLWRAQLPSPPVQAPSLSADGLLVRVAMPEAGQQASLYAGPSHGAAIRGEGTLDATTTGAREANDQALAWRWMAGYPPAYAWLWMAMDDVEGLPGPEPPPGDASPTPTNAKPATSEPLEPTPDGRGIWPAITGAPSKPGVGLPETWPHTGPNAGVLPGIDEDDAGAHLAVLLDRHDGADRLHIRGSARGQLIWEGDHIIWVAAGAIVALDASSGQIGWSHPTEAQARADGQISLVAGEGAVYVVAAGRLEALNLHDGKRRWAVPTAGRVAPVISAHELLYLEGGQLKALSLQGGQLRWWTAAPGVVDAPLIQDGVAYLETVSGEILAFRLSDGKPRWRVAAGARGNPMLTAERYVWVDKRALMSVTLDDGELSEPIPLPAPGLSPRWQPNSRGEDLCPLAQGDDLLLKIDPDRLALMRP